MAQAQENDGRVNWSSRLYLAFADDPQPAIDFLEWLIGQYELPPASHILDLGAGPGAVFSCYDERPWSVLALEPDPDFLAYAKQVAAGMDSIEVRQGGFADVAEQEQFDLAVSINGGFAYLLECEAQRDALRRLYAALKPGGVLLLDIPNLLWFLRYEPDVKHYTARLDELTVDFWRRCFFDYHEAQFVQTNEYVVRDNEGQRLVVRKTHSHVIWTYPALSQLLRTCGFVELQTYDDYTARESDRLNGPRIMVAARRPAV